MSNTIKTFAKHYVTRNEAARTNMIESIARAGKIGNKAAAAVFDLYKKERVFKFDGVNGVYSVKHGAFLDESTIENALRIINMRTLGV
jgi:hypothetical protein